MAVGTLEMLDTAVGILGGHTAVWFPLASLCWRLFSFLLGGSVETWSKCRGCRLSPGWGPWCRRDECVGFFREGNAIQNSCWDDFFFFYSVLIMGPDLLMLISLTNSTQL